MRPHRARSTPPVRPRRAPGHGRPYAPGDGPLVADVVSLGVPFSFDGAFAQRLMRRKINPSEAFTVCNRNGAFFRASLQDLSPEGGNALPYELMDSSPEPTVEITLGCAVLARQRMIFVVQKATELGVTQIVPLFTTHSVPPEGLEHEKAHAWPGQVIRAARQCRRSSLPAVAPPSPLEVFLASPAWRDADLRLYLDDRAEGASPEWSSPRRIAIVTGPEGGFSEQERTMLRETGLAWRLGGRVLRAETAVMVGLVAVHLMWGDLKAAGGPTACR